MTIKIVKKVERVGEYMEGGDRLFFRGTAPVLAQTEVNHAVPQHVRSTTSVLPPQNLNVWCLNTVQCSFHVFNTFNTLKPEIRPHNIKSFQATSHRKHTQFQLLTTKTVDTIHGRN